MNLQTFKAPTMAEALTQVKSTMGTDAVILHTRTFHTRHWLGLRRREMVEITAGRGINITARAPRRAPVETRQLAVEPRPAGAGGLAAYSRIAAAAGVAPVPAVSVSAAVAAPRNPVVGGRQFLETPAASNAVLMGISQEMTALKAMVKDLVSQARHQAS